MKRTIVTGAALMILGATGCAGMAERRFVAGVKDKPAPDFELTTLEGGQVKLRDFRGKPVVLAFWAFG